LWVYSDDGWRRNGGTQSIIQTWSSSTTVITDFYQYDRIRDCNEVISRIPNVTFSTLGMAELLDAEARFIRALIYERMVLFFGDVPLVTEPQDLDFFPSRDPRETVFNFVINEFGDIADALPESITEAKGRITRWAALTMQARAYLNAVGWHSDPASLYAGAQAALDEIISDSPHQLDDGTIGFRRLFTPASDLGGSVGSNEVILAYCYVEDLITATLPNICLPRGAYVGTGDGAPNNNFAIFGATVNIVEAFQTINGKAPSDDPAYDPANPFENRDPRLRATFILPGDSLISLAGTEFYIFQPHPMLATVFSDNASRNTGIDTGYLMRKYAGLSLIDNASLEYQNVVKAHADFKIIRYAEVLLMMAETYASGGDVANTLFYINEVRRRVGMPEYLSINDVPTNVLRGTTGNPLIDAVLLERRYEFSGEAPHRFSDVWRYRLGDQVYGVVEGMPEDETLPGDLAGPKTTYANTSREWDDKLYLLPLPIDAFNINPNLGENNPGW